MDALVMKNNRSHTFSNTLTSNRKQYKTGTGAAAAMVEEAKRLLAQAEAELSAWVAFDAGERDVLTVATPATARDFSVVGEGRWEGVTAR